MGVNNSNEFLTPTYISTYLLQHSAVTDELRTQCGGIQLPHGRSARRAKRGCTARRLADSHCARLDAQCGMRYLVGADHSARGDKIIAGIGYHTAVRDMPRLIEFNEPLLAPVGTVDIDNMRCQRYRIGKFDRIQHIVAGQPINADYMPPLAHARICGGE